MSQLDQHFSCWSSFLLSMFLKLSNFKNRLVVCVKCFSFLIISSSKLKCVRIFMRLNQSIHSYISSVKLLKRGLFWKFQPVKKMKIAFWLGCFHYSKISSNKDLKLCNVSKIKRTPIWISYFMTVFSTRIPSVRLCKKELLCSLLVKQPTLDRIACCLWKNFQLPMKLLFAHSRTTCVKQFTTMMSLLVGEQRKKLTGLFK